MKTKLIAGFFVSALLVYLSVRGIDFPGVARGMETLRYGYALLFLAVILLMQVLRSVRWGLMLQPLAKVDQLTLFSVSNVGFLAIIAIPARLGELARPYLITRRSPITMTPAVGTIFVERICDSLAVLLIALMTPLFTVLPPWLTRAGLIFFWIALTAAAVILFLVMRRDLAATWLRRFLRRLPERWGLLPERMLHQFSEGFAAFRTPRLLLAIILLTLVIWLIDVLSIYLMFLAFGLDLPVVAAVVVMIVLVIGIAIPAAPGFVGNWHYFNILALGIFGIPKTEALSFAIIYHFLTIGLFVALGLASLPCNRFSLSSLTQRGGNGTGTGEGD